MSGISVYRAVGLVAQPMKWNDPYLVARRSSRTMTSNKHGESPPKIERNVPIPEKKKQVSKFDHFYPFENMKVGDSFWVAGDQYCTSRAVTQFTARTGWRFVTKGQSRDGRKNCNVGKHEERGQRVWRVE